MGVQTYSKYEEYNGHISQDKCRAMGLGYLSNRSAVIQICQACQTKEKRNLNLIYQIIPQLHSFFLLLLEWILDANEESMLVILCYK